MADPAICVAYEQDACFRVEADKPFEPEPGYQWQDVHIGPDCAGDVVTQTLNFAEPPFLIEFSGTQLGVHMRTRRSLTPTETGCLYEEEIAFTPALRGGFGPTAILARLLTILGLTPKFTQDPVADEYWCHQLNVALAERYQA